MQKSFHLYVLPQREEAGTPAASCAVRLSLLVNSHPQGPALWRSTWYSGRKRKQIKIHHTKRECKHLVSLTSSELLPDSLSPMDLREGWYLETQELSEDTRSKLGSSGILSVQERKPFGFCLPTLRERQGFTSQGNLFKW